MGFREIVAKETGLPKERIPGGYQILGHVMLLNFPKGAEKNKIAEAILKLFPNIRTVCEFSGSKGELREPKVTVLAGNGTEVLHKESDIIYHMDAAHVMFSKGNFLERARLISAVKKGEIIVDMFAGIGYFALGLAKFSKAGKIVAIEKNPVSFRYLRNNLKINKVNFETIFGDCRDFAAGIENYADRVIMGYFSGTEQFLEHAVRIAKNRGIVHYHNSYFQKDLWKKAVADVRKSCPKAKILAKRKVKSVGPKTYHVVVDFQVVK